MIMKNPLYFLLTSFVIFYSCNDVHKKEVLPAPIDTQIKWNMEDGTKPDRKVWEAKMHRSAEDVYWENVELQNNKDLIKLRNHLIEQNGQKDPGVPETIVEDHLSGSWSERGSNNQSGHIAATEFDPETNTIYALSNGGNLWKGNIDGTGWVPQNQYFSLYHKVLHLFENDRMVAISRGYPHYSDDAGLTWNLSGGFGSIDAGWTVRSSTKLILDSGDTELFILHRSDFWSNVGLYISTDKGENYQLLIEFDESDINNFSLAQPIGTSDLYLIEQTGGNKSNIHKWNRSASQMEMITEDSPLGFGNERANFTGVMLDSLRLFAYNKDNELHSTDDLGVSWNYVGQLPIEPWDVQLFISPSNPNFMFTGGVNAFRSLNGGEDWFEINDWSEYYSNVQFKLHADIMHYNEFVDSDGTPFLLISNHGGLSISYNQGVLNRNLGLEGLNVSQYYSAVSSPVDPTYVFAGSQDQGFQRGRILAFPQVADFDQVISGDYGHIIFTKNGLKLWTVYPGGWVTYYDKPFNEFQTHTASYDLVSNNESVWIPPMMAHPNEDENIAYMAGGSALGGAGRFIIELKYQGGQIVATNLPFDFSVSGGSISAMSVNEFNDDIWYVATDNGKFYVSQDHGISFVESSMDLAGGHYLYGSDILSSKLNQNELWLSGNGYSNAGVLHSKDGGLSWEAMDQGLPSTMTFGIDANEDESLIFAATEAGPFVYVVELKQWYPLFGTTAAPLTRYWSVQYVPELKMVRYGTYGRGVWDFEITGTSSLEDEFGNTESFDLKLYPNPVVNSLNVSIDEVLLEGSRVNLKIISLDGKEYFSQEMKNKSQSIDVSELPLGSYITRIEKGAHQRTKIFVKQ